MGRMTVTTKARSTPENPKARREPPLPQSLILRLQEPPKEVGLLIGTQTTVGTQTAVARQDAELRVPSLRNFSCHDRGFVQILVWHSACRRAGSGWVASDQSALGPCHFC